MNKSKPIWYIYGCGGLGLETMDILEDNIRYGIIEDHNCIFVVDGVGESHVDGYDVIDFTDTLRGSKITIAVGEPASGGSAQITVASRRGKGDKRSSDSF